MLRRQLDVAANNLANASTTGFRQDELVFNDVLERNLSSSGKALGQLGYGPANVLQMTDFGTMGQLIPTGNPLDVALESPEGAFAVRSADGVIRYTRDGAFTRNSEGQLATKQGFPVLDDRLNPIDLPQGTVSVASNGVITVNGEEVGTIGVFNGKFNKAGNNLLEGAAELVTEPAMKGGTLESSNVNTVATMVGMIELQRAFEIAQRSVTAQDELAQRLISILQER